MRLDPWLWNSHYMLFALRKFDLLRIPLMYLNRGDFSRRMLDRLFANHNNKVYGGNAAFFSLTLDARC